MNRRTSFLFAVSCLLGLLHARPAAADRDYPLIPLRFTDLKPGGYMSITVARRKSLSALRKAMTRDNRVVAVQQRDGSVEDPGPGDLRDTGTLARITEMGLGPRSTPIVKLRGEQRVRLVAVRGDMATVAELSSRVESVTRGRPGSEDAVPISSGGGRDADDPSMVSWLRRPGAEPRKPAQAAAPVPTPARDQDQAWDEPLPERPGPFAAAPWPGASRRLKLSGALLAGLAFLGLAAAGLLWMVRSMRGPRDARLEGLRRDVDEAAQADPQEAFGLYLRCLNQGGEPAQFKPAALVNLFISSSRETALVGHLAGKAPASYILKVASALAERNRHGLALELMADDVLAHAARKEEACDLVTNLHVRGGKAGELVRRVRGLGAPAAKAAFARALIRQQLAAKAVELLDAGGGDPEALGVRAQALLAMGRAEEAAAALNAKPRASWNDDDYVTLFRANLAAGRWDQAREAYGPVRVRRSLKSAPDLHYAFALACEERGDRRLAADIYRRFASEGMAYRDVAERLLLIGDAGAPGAEDPFTAGRARTPTPATPASPAAQPPPPGPAPVAPPPLAHVLTAPKGLVGAKYELIRPIGEGGMGSVYEAHDRSLDRRVAIKKMRSEVRARELERARFLKEARAVARLSHPYIVGIHEIVEQDGEIYLVLEYVHGRSLAAVLDERRRLGLADCQGILSYVCQAVDYAHRCNVLHRDLKPSNIMLGADGYAKVADFGLAAEAKDAAARASHKDASGTPGYMAPEQHRGQPVKASDVYAMGVTLYEMLAGEPPFKGPDLAAIKERGRFAPASSLAPGLPKAVDALLAAALEPDPARRLPDAPAFWNALAKAHEA